MALPSPLEILTAAGAARVDPALAVWTLSDPFWPAGDKARRVRSGKREILAWLLQHEPRAFLVIDETDLMREVAGASETGVEHTWQLDPAIQPADLDAAILYLGLWSLYGAPEPIDPGALRVGDPRNARDVASILERLRLTFLVISGYDDDTWQIALADRVWRPER